MIAVEQKIEDFNAVITKIVVAHKWTFAPSSVYDCSKHRNSYGFVYLLTGELQYRFSTGKHLTAKAGDLILLKPQDAYKAFCPNECQHYTVNFQILPSSITGEAAKKVLLSSDTAILRQNPSIHAQIELFERLCEVWKKKDAGYQLQAISFTYSFLHTFIKKQLALYRNDKYDKLKPAIDFLESHWNQELSLSFLAGSCFLSVSHFRHLFNQVFQMSPMEYRDSLRLLYAKDYLLQGCYTVTKVADLCGFEDVNYFSRFFKKHTGISPSKYLFL